MRMIYNDAFFIDTNVRPEEKLISSSSDVLLRSLMITVGNLCNLQCRMCNPYSSSRIAADPIHSFWFGKRGARTEMKGIEESYVGMLKESKSLTHLQISGGEPLIIPNVHKILQEIVDSGRAQDVILMMPTNCTGVKDKVLDLLSKFKEVHLRLSIDGYGPANEYIRFPGQWKEVVETIGKLQRLENARLSIGFTLSALNVFEVAKTASFGDAMNIPFTFGVVHSPSRLSANILPQSTLEDAARIIDRASEHINIDSSRRELSAVSSLLRRFASKERNKGIWTKFIEFNNDLDHARGQSIEASLPELVASIGVTEGPWQSELRHVTSTQSKNAQRASL